MHKSLYPAIAALLLTVTPAMAGNCHAVDAAALLKMGVLNDIHHFSDGPIWLNHQQGGMHCSAWQYDLSCRLYDPRLVHLNYRGTDYFFASPAGSPMQLDMHDGKLNCATG